MTRLGRATGVALAIVVVGVTLRALAAVLWLDVVWADEHFQTLEPASQLVFGYGWSAWEWVDGARSWIVPALYVPPLWLAKAFGAEGGPAAIIACRLMMVALSGALLWRFHRLLAELGQPPLARCAALGAMALAPGMIAWGPTTLSDTWALCLLWLPMPYVLRALGAERRRAWVLAGALLGLPFLARFHTALWAAGVGLSLLAERRARVLPWLAAGYLVPVAVYGIVDWTTWGSPFHSIAVNLRVNVVAGFASEMGESPWYDYFPRLWESIGPVVSTLVLAQVAAALLWRRLPLGRNSARLLVPALVYAIAHAAIPHKETRFLLPIFPVVFFLAGAALTGLLTRWRELVPSPALVLLGAGALGAAAFPFVHREAHYERSDASSLGRAMREDGGFRARREACLLLVNHYWIWLRGELMQGQKVRWAEIPIARLADPATRDGARGCVYAVVAQGGGEALRAALGPSWTKLAENEWGHILFRNEDVAPALGRPISPERVPASLLVRLYEEAIAKDPENEALHRKFAELCLERRLPCAREQYEWLRRRGLLPPR